MLGVLPSKGGEQTLTQPGEGHAYLKSARDPLRNGKGCE